jgi:hypothetical protein
VQSWLDEEEELPVDAHALLAETKERIAAWNVLGRDLCDAFVDAAERVAAPV